MCVCVCVYRLERQAASERGQVRERVEQLNREAVAKDLRIQALQDSCDKLRLDAASATEDLKRCGYGALYMYMYY